MLNNIILFIAKQDIDMKNNIFSERFLSFLTEIFFKPDF